MKSKISKALCGSSVVVGVGLAGVLLMTSGSIGRAQSSPSASKKGIQGTWLVQVTLRNCATSAPLGSFNSIVTFHHGGTMSETTSSPAFAIGQRSPGHGNWTSEGRHRSRQRMINLINFDTAANLPGTPGFNPSLPVTPGFFAGWSTITHTGELSDENHGTSAGTNEFYKSDGTVQDRLLDGGVRAV